MTTLSLKQLAQRLGGVANAGCVLCPGPGHSRNDRSLSVVLSPDAPDGFVVHSFSGDDPIACRDYVRERAGMEKVAPAPKQDRTGAGVTEPNPMLSAALAIAAEGIPVFACGSNKAPLTRNGFKDATCDPDKLAVMFANVAAVMIGMPTGEDSGIVVLDVDQKENRQGMDWLNENSHRMVQTRTVRTGSGGLHIYFRHPGRQVKNQNDKIAPGIDVRGDGGYVIVPPTNGYDVADNAPIADIPDWLMPALCPDELVRPPVEPRTKPALDPISTGHLKYAASAFDSECAAVERAPEGNRNHTLNIAAMKLGQFVGAGVLTDIMVTAGLEEAAAKCGLPSAEAKATIRSGLTKGMSEPRKLAAEVSSWRDAREVGRQSARHITGEDKASEPDADEEFGIAFSDLKRKEFAPVKWIVQDIIPEGTTFLAGRPKLGKSWLAFDIAILVATAGAGWVLSDKDCGDGDVLYLALEDNERRLQSRGAKLIPFGSEWPARLTVALQWPRAGDGGLAKIERWAARAENPVLVIVDVLTAFRDHPGPRETKSTYATDYDAVAGLRDLGNRLGVSILIVHHVRKGDSDDPIEAVSGTLGLSGAADSILVLNRRSDTGVTLYGRGRDMEEIDLAVEFHSASCRWSVKGETADVRRSDERNRILELLTETDEFLTVPNIVSDTGMKRANVDKLLERMAKAGEVLKAGRGKYLHPKNAHLLDALISPPSQKGQKVRKKSVFERDMERAAEVLRMETGDPRWWLNEASDAIPEL